MAEESGRECGSGGVKRTDTMNKVIDIEHRLENIEKILKMLVVNSLVDDLNRSMNYECEDELEASEELKELLYKYNLIVNKLQMSNGFTFVYISIDENNKYRLKNFIDINHNLKEHFEHLVPVFEFKTMNGMQRKRFIEENISFQIKDKEIHIYAK